MSRLFVRWAVNAIALWVAIQIVPGVDHDGSGISLLIIALIFGLVNALVRPLIVLLTCPLIVVTMGLFILVVNAIMLALTDLASDMFNLGLVVDGFWATFWAALVISLISGLINLLIKDDNEGRDRNHR